jgi:hypothetical protein
MTHYTTYLIEKAIVLVKVVITAPVESELLKPMAKSKGL